VLAVQERFVSVSLLTEGNSPGSPLINFAAGVQDVRSSVGNTLSRKASRRASREIVGVGRNQLYV
jgi:hypothetical protein